MDRYVHIGAGRVCGKLVKDGVKCAIVPPMKRSLALALFLLFGCKSELPTQYLVCSAEEQKCRVTASFKDLKSCEFFKELSGIYCDWDSDPEKIICYRNRRSIKSTGLCKPNMDARS